MTGYGPVGNAELVERVLGVFPDSAIAALAGLEWCGPEGSAPGRTEACPVADVLPVLGGMGLDAETAEASYGEYVGWGGIPMLVCPIGVALLNLPARTLVETIVEGCEEELTGPYLLPSALQQPSADEALALMTYAGIDGRPSETEVVDFQCRWDAGEILPTELEAFVADRVGPRSAV